MIPAVDIAAFTSLDGEEWTRYADMPIPCTVDEAISALLSRFRAADARQREQLRLHVTPQRRGLLFVFSTRMARRAVQERSVEPLRQGLTAIALEGDSPGSDWRDTGSALLSLRAAAEGTGVAQGEFTAAAALAAGRTARLIERSGPRRAWRRAFDSALEALIRRLIPVHPKGASVQQ